MRSLSKHRKTLLVTTGFILVIFVIIKLALSQVFDISHSSAIQQCDATSGMVLISGGEFTLGAGAMYPEETPAMRTKVGPFLMSRHEVTNREFTEFVDATGYVTVAERIPNPSLYPDIPAESLTAGSAVFVKLSEAMQAATVMNWWHFIEGANWRHPSGPQSNINGKDYFPVVHIAYSDAQAYARWKGHRLPTEAEFEFASRGGLDGAVYARGNSLTQDNKHIANTWQGLFPFSDSAEDGFAGLAPVGCYSQNEYGMHDLIGNVWEWTQTTYYPRHITAEQVPTLPKTGLDDRQPGVPVGVIKGGSYLCAEDFCMRYRPAARQAQDTGLGTSHIGFRTVQDI